ncbi:MAG TPA: carboxymuconolactone decarboxylase family protein [Caulobacteraceae bacterium]|jgi:alkyl hydroperoxide reductase subunit D|nr:carboxymuconolactone decarboxylase family protein [Caulobacteraceae bacterium]
MALEALSQTLPPYARDVGANLVAIAAEQVLTEPQKWGCFVAAAHAVATPAVVQAVGAAAAAAGQTAAQAAAKGAAAIMAQNNIYFRALSLLKNPEYRALRSRLRMSITLNPGVPKDDFDLWCVAVSAIHGCPDCLDAHEGALRSRGVSAEAVQAALRIAAVVHAASRVVAAVAAET